MGRHTRQVEIAAVQQHVGDHGEADQRKHGHPVLEGQAWNRQPGNQGEEPGKDDIGTPDFRARVQAVDELGEACVDEHPAGAFARAVVAGSAYPVGVDKRPLHRGNHEQVENIQADQSKDRVDRAVEQVAA